MYVRITVFTGLFLPHESRDLIRSEEFYRAKLIWYLENMWTGGAGGRGGKEYKGGRSIRSLSAPQSRKGP
jgi:hypothetical protein